MIKGFCTNAGAAFAWRGGDREERLARRFHSSSLLRGWLRGWTAADLSGTHVARLDDVVAQISGDSTAPFAAYVSPPGRWQRIVLIVHTRNRRSIFKVAIGPGARESCVAEALSLQFVGRTAMPRGFLIPTLVSHRNGPDFCLNELSFHEQANGRVRIGISEVSPFLEALKHSSVSTADSASFCREAEVLMAAQPDWLGPLWMRRLGWLVSEFRANGKEFRTCFVHRDFAPWNVFRADDGRIVIHDWEYGRAGGIVGHDAFHFLYMPRILASSFGIQILRRKLINNIRSEAQQLVAGYFLDVSTQYILANLKEERPAGASVLKEGKVLSRLGVVVDELEGQSWQKYTS